MLMYMCVSVCVYVFVCVCVGTYIHIIHMSCVRAYSTWPETRGGLGGLKPPQIFPLILIFKY